MTELGRILFADDEPSFLKSMSELLRCAGYACDCATDAFTALPLLRLKEYDLLISDINMPGNSELEFIREVSQIVPGLPIILMTGSPALDIIRQSLELPVVACLIKPFPFNELLWRVAPAVRYRQNFRLVHKIPQPRPKVELQEEINS